MVLTAWMNDRSGPTLTPRNGLADWEITIALAKAMGLDMSYPHPSDIMDEIARLTPSFAGVSYGKLEELGSIQIEQRVARYLVKRHAQAGDGPVRVSQAGIASELGTAREVVFRALRSLAERGLIETGRMSIRVLDLEALTRAGGGG